MPKTLYFKFSLITIVSIFAIMAVQIIAGYRFRLHSYNQELIQTTEQTIGRLEKNVGEFIEVYAVFDYENAISREMVNADFAAIIIDDQNIAHSFGKQHYFKGKIRNDRNSVVDYDPDSPQHHAILQEAVYQSDRIIKKNGKVIGKIGIYATNQRLAKPIEEFVKISVVQTFVVCVFLSFILLFSIRKFLTQPIHKLSVVARAIESGDYETRATVDSKDEVGELSTTFNSMAEQLKQTLDNLQKEIEERKQTENALRESENFLDAIIENIPDMIFVKEAKELRFVRFNKAGEDLIGFSRKSMIGKNDYDFFPKEQADFFTRKDREALRKGTLSDIKEEPIKTQNKGERILHTQKIPLSDDNGNPLYLLGISEDITERKRAEEALKASEEKFYKAFDLNPNILTIIDLETKQRLAVNDSFSELVGYSKKELMENPLGALGEIDIETVELAIETIKQGGSLRDIEVKLKNKNGTERLMLYSFNGIEVDNRNCMIVSGKDITNRKKAEEDLLISENRYRNLFQNAPIPLWEEDFTDVYKLIEECKEKGVRNFRKYVDAHPSFLEKCSQKVKILDVNQEALNLHHAKTKNELLGNLDDIFTEKSFDTFKEEIISLSEGFLQFESEGEVKTLSGEKKSIYLKMIIEKEKGERYKALIATIDISDRKKWEERLRQAQKIESIGSLAGGIAHDFNNLLFPIIGMSEMLLEDLPKDSLEYENATEIFQAGKRAGDLVQQILAFSRRSERKMTPVRIQNVLKEVLKLSRSTIPSNIEIQQNIQQNCGLVMADPTQIHQVAMNLITNAFHAVEEKNGVIDLELKEVEIKENEIPDSELKGGQYIKLSVSDNGTGISRNTMHKIFEPYFTTKEQGKGTGLGLAVVYGIIKEHEGEIKVYSEIGKGATFNIYLPLMKKNNKIEKKDKSVGMLTGTERILLVDDEVSIAKLEGQMLSRLGYQVTVKTHSLDALNTFRSNPDSFDLVISDMTMPHMTGDQLSKDILSTKPDTPIIICTGFSERINKERAEMLGVKGFLMKPVVKSDIAQMVRKVLDDAKA